jgi:hypothetical protein
MNVVIEIGELKLAEPSFRTKARIVAHTNHRKVTFALQYQHDGEPGVWLADPSFPWHGRNFDSIIRAAAGYHQRIKDVIRKEEHVQGDNQC